MTLWLETTTNIVETTNLVSGGGAFSLRTALSLAFSTDKGSSWGLLKYTAVHLGAVGG